MRDLGKTQRNNFLSDHTRNPYHPFAATQLGSLDFLAFPTVFCFAFSSFITSYRVPLPVSVLFFIFLSKFPNLRLSSFGCSYLRVLSAFSSQAYMQTCKLNLTNDSALAYSSTDSKRWKDFREFYFFAFKNISDE